MPITQILSSSGFKKKPKDIRRWIRFTAWKKLLETLLVFKITLKFLSWFSRRSHFDTLTRLFSTLLARLNIQLNKPNQGASVGELANEWQKMMPPDGKEYFPIKNVTKDTAYVEIHLHCPLRGTGDVQACYKLMNYDRKLMEGINGQLIVLESQSNSGQHYCKLAIRKADEETDDLTTAHVKK